MQRETPAPSAGTPDRPPGAPTVRAIARGDGWRVSEFTCHLGPGDRRFEERHEDVAISAVVEGAFQYRSVTGRALLSPGSLLLGNPGACFECGHDHGRGDRCIGFHFAPGLFEEIAAAVAGSHRFRFKTPMLPAIRELAGPVVEAEMEARSGNRIAWDELAIRLAETVLTALSGVDGATRAPSPRDERRISNVLRHIEEHFDQPLDLTDLAGLAFMSKYHFLRTFRRTVGVTPSRYLLGVRVRRAAVALCATPVPVATIAFDAGFGDLSTFNRHFRQAFGVSPAAFRRAPGRLSARART
jgi:AraC-like DNA-binding protein